MFKARPGTKNGGRNRRKDEGEKRWMTNEVNELDWALGDRVRIA